MWLILQAWNTNYNLILLKFDFQIQNFDAIVCCLDEKNVRLDGNVDKIVNYVTVIIYETVQIHQTTLKFAKN
jgi:hypothetical protein